MKKLTAGTQLKPHEWHDIQGKCITFPQQGYWTHIQFRRYSGCAVCNLHLHSFLSRQKELIAHRIQEIVVFNSTPERIKADLPQCPLAIVSDVNKHLYAEIGVGTTVMAVLNPAVWLPAMRGAAQFGVQLPRDEETSLGLPADFLIDDEGKIVAVYYGKHAYDQWSVDQLLDLVTHQGVVV